MTNSVGTPVAIIPYPSGQKNYRAIGPEASGGPSGSLTFTADVTEREEHNDEMAITEHPVENTSGLGSVSDHAYRRPAEVHLRLGWSNSGSSDPNHVQSVYASLLQFKNDRWPFDLYTGKRQYSNMLIAALIVETDQSSEWALRLDCHIREVLLVNTQTFSVTSDQSNLGNPSANAPTANTGSQQLQTGGATATQAQAAALGTDTSLPTPQVANAWFGPNLINPDVATAVGTNPDGSITLVTPQATTPQVVPMGAGGPVT